MPDSIDVLISLHRGYGIGDACQMSAVLRHVAKYRPHWRVSYRAEEGKHQVGRGLVKHHFAYGMPYPAYNYHADITVTLYDKWYGYTDRPNTHVSSCLKEHFDLDWDAECGRYQVNVSDEMMVSVAAIVPRKSVAIHYQGDSCPENKNLTEYHISNICDIVFGLGYIPLLIDWRNNSPMRHHRMVRTVGGYDSSLRWGPDIEANCAVIRQCAAFIGIDSGPAKCASATDTPSLVVWTRHHPAQFHDPAPNTTHIVSKMYHEFYPVYGNQNVIKWFESNYHIREYKYDLVECIKQWLREVLK